MTRGINSLSMSHALRIAARFGARARRTGSHQVVLQEMVNSFAEALSAKRAAFYRLDTFGNLHIHKANSPEVIEESHVRDMPPEGPLEIVLEKYKERLKKGHTSSENK